MISFLNYFKAFHYLQDSWFLNSPLRAHRPISRQEMIRMAIGSVCAECVEIAAELNFFSIVRAERMSPTVKLSVPFPFFIIKILS